MTPFIEFIETYKADGYTHVAIKAEGLPEGMYYRMTVRPDGWVEAKSRARGAGSTRYYTHRTLEAAQQHATAWARRKIAEARSEEKRRRLERFAREKALREAGEASEARVAAGRAAKILELFGPRRPTAPSAG